MNQDLAEIACVIDRSGSMQRVRDDAIGGFNSFLHEQKQESGQANLTLVLFNHEYEIVHSGRDLQQAPELTKDTYVPQGTTAMLDAVGRTIDDIGNRLASMNEDERPHKVIVAILTDGLENASKDYTRDRIKKMIAHQQEHYGWEFFFLAANMDAVREAKGINISAACAIEYASNAEGTADAYRRMSRLVSDSRQG